MSNTRLLLQRIGLEADQVSRAFGLSTPREEAGYLTGEEQRRVRHRLEVNNVFILALAIEGHTAGLIAALFGVSDESVKRRLRPFKLTRPKHRPAAEK